MITLRHWNYYENEQEKKNSNNTRQFFTQILERLSGVDLGHIGARGGFVLSVGSPSSQAGGRGGGDDSGRNKNDCLY